MVSKVKHSDFNKSLWFSLETWIYLKPLELFWIKDKKTHLHYSNWKISEDFLVFWEKGHLVIFLYILSAFYGVYKSKPGKMQDNNF